MKVLISLVLLVICCAGTIWAQDNSKIAEKQCENYGKEKFVGSEISINVEKTNIRDIFKIFTEKFGCDFVVDNSLDQLPTSIDFEKVPWNILLDAILRSQKLGIQKNGTILQIAKLETSEDVGLLFIEQIKLKHLPNNSVGRTKEKLLELIKRRLSRRGQVKFDDLSNTLIINDTSKNIAALKELVKIIDVEVNMKEYLEEKKKCEELEKNNGCIRCPK